MAIERFRGEHYYLSSMYPLENGVQIPDGRVVSCVEIAYLPERFVDEADREKVLAAPDGFAAKRLTNELQETGSPIRPDWELGKLSVMRVYVAQKFERHPELMERLAETGDEEIYEGNNRGDNFWGVTPIGGRHGQNWLGRILMDTRRTAQQNLQVILPAVK